PDSRSGFCHFEMLSPGRGSKPVPANPARAAPARVNEDARTEEASGAAGSLFSMGGTTAALGSKGCDCSPPTSAVLGAAPPVEPDGRSRYFASDSPGRITGV